MAHIAGLTALTRLELCELRCNTNLEALRGLRLQKLALSWCPGVAETLIAPGALTALQELQIFEEKEEHKWESLDSFRHDLQISGSARHERAVQLQELSRIVLDHPSLLAVSGQCQLFSVVMAEVWQAWFKSQFEHEKYSIWHAGIGCLKWRK